MRLWPHPENCLMMKSQHFKRKKTPKTKPQKPTLQLHKSSKCKIQTLSLSHTHRHTHRHTHTYTHILMHTYAHTHIHFNHSWQTSSTNTPEVCLFRWLCQEGNKRVCETAGRHTLYQRSARGVSTVPCGAACHETCKIKQKSGPAFQSQSLALLQHRSFLNLAVRQKKGLGLIWSKDCTTYFSQTDVQRERRWVQ